MQAGEGAAHIARHTQQGSEANSTEETKENKTMFVNFEIDLLLLPLAPNFKKN